MAAKQKKVPVHVRVDEDVKKQAVAILQGIGMDMSTAINVFLRQVIADNGLPFQQKQAQFNKETIAAIDTEPISFNLQ